MCCGRTGRKGPPQSRCTAAGQIPVRVAYFSKCTAYNTEWLACCPAIFFEAFHPTLNYLVVTIRPCPQYRTLSSAIEHITQHQYARPTTTQAPEARGVPYCPQGGRELD